MSELWDSFLQAPLTNTERSTLEKDLSLAQTPAFNGLPEFGTGGMRAITGLGTRYLNRYNIGRLVLAISRYLKEKNESSLVVIAYDSRITSQEFTNLSYNLLIREGLECRCFKQPTPTPLLSFAVRELKAQCGIVITASHNPPEYNGYKVYASDGGQIVSPADKEITNFFVDTSYNKLPTDLHMLAEKEIPSSDLIEEEIFSSYIQNLSNEPFLEKKNKSLSILYSPLHGTGAWCFEKAFAHFGYENFKLLEKESNPDGHFTGLKSANPEEKDAFIGLLDASVDEKPQVLLATDPDADRMGCAILHEGDYVFLTGNQIGALLLDWTAQKGAASKSNPYMCKTIVTSEFQSHIAQSHGLRVIETLTGFKHIAGAIEKDPDNYVFGGEESYGYLPVTWVRDKDSISASLALTELANNHSLIEKLTDLQVQHGLYHEELKNLIFGQHELHKMQDFMGKLKDAASLIGSTLGARTIIDVLDLHEGAVAPVTNYCQDLKHSLPPAAVYQFYLDPEARVTIRPSGTEPKVKIYVSLRYKSKANRESILKARSELAEEASLVLQDFLKIVGA
jgi:phosphomannomutase